MSTAWLALFTLERPPEGGRGGRGVSGTLGEGVRVTERGVNGRRSNTNNIRRAYSGTQQ